MVRVKWLAEGKWDQTYLSDLFNDLSKYESDRQVVVIPGAEYAGKADDVNKILSEYDKVLAVITSDEESLFDADDLKHDDMIIYSQYPTDDKSKSVDFWIPIMYTPHIRKALKKRGMTPKTLDWFFSGQITHESREKLYEKLKDMDGGMLLGTEGFTQGFEPEVYSNYMQDAKVVPSPWGVAKPEAFRTYEAFEAGAVPIPQGRDYHRKILDDGIFTYLEEWDKVDEQIANYVQRYPRLNNHVMSWWLQQKRRIKQRFLKDLGIEVSPVTILMSSSPIPSNPDTTVIEKSIQSARRHFPDSEVIIMCDGVRKEQQHLQANYQEFLRTILWKANLEWDDVTVIAFEEHEHQLGMTRKTIPLITTDLVLFMEHDMLLKSRKIDWEKIVPLVQSDEIDTMRFYFDRQLEPAHEYLFTDMQPERINGVPLVKTGQWSQRPHLSKTSYYQRVLYEYTSDKANAMIEDAIHGHIADDFVVNGWGKHKIAIYTPGENYSFAYHIDGRGDESKFVETQVY